MVWFFNSLLSFLFYLQVRYHLPIVIVIVNNSGIYSGFTQEDFKDMQKLGDPTLVTPVTSLNVEVKYEQMMTMFNKKGYFVRTIPELQDAVRDALIPTDHPSIINVIISPQADRKPQNFSWLTESKL